MYLISIRLSGGSVRIDRILANGDVLDLDGIKLEVFHTPGHSTGSISLLLPEDRALFTGDTIPLAKDMDEALIYLARIHEAVTEVVKNDIPDDPMEICRLVLRKLKLPEMTANPLIARSFAAHRNASTDRIDRI